MKTLILLRHAKSSWDDPSVSDFARPLNPRGAEAARAMGRAMRDLGLTADRVLASPAVRVVQTLEGLGEALGPIAPIFDERVYLASAPTLLDMIRAADDLDERLMVVGHNPGLAELALQLARGGALRDRIAVKYPTGALAEIAFEVERWCDVMAGAGTLARFIRPRDLDAEAG
ncbi:MAG TPA: histidine phosphatase family protein [Allosphingosinicella sp.]|nr:histidine phosphatase family protein [Allosphingosinicella sp.]